MVVATATAAPVHQTAMVQHQSAFQHLLEVGMIRVAVADLTMIGPVAIEEAVADTAIVETHA